MRWKADNLKLIVTSYSTALGEQTVDKCLVIHNFEGYLQGRWSAAADYRTTIGAVAEIKDITMLTSEEKGFLERAIQLSQQGMEKGNGGPFGCVVVKDNQIVGEGCNMVTSLNDPTAHAEVMAIRHACQHLHTYQLTGCDIYTSCEPCPMCLGAIYWARPRRVIYANTREDAATIEFDDAFIYNEINAGMKERKIPFQHEPHPLAQQVFMQWREWEEKKKY